MGTGERRLREKERRRSDIVDAARALFFARGFRGTTIDDIAKSTELARGTVYLYFENKEAIYATVLEEGLDILLKMVRESKDPGLDPLSNLLRAHDAFLTFHDKHPEYYSALILDKLEISQCLPQTIKERLDGKMTEMVQTIAGCLQDGVDEDMFRPMNVFSAALLQMGISMGFTLMLDTCPDVQSRYTNRQESREMLHGWIANGILSRNGDGGLKKAS